MKEKIRDLKINEREKKLILLISLGYTDNDAAKEFKLSIGGIRRIVNILLNKTKTTNRSHLVGWAYREGILKRG